VKQKHTHDIIWSELLCILNWYNPFAWLIRKAIRQNLEFIADDKVLEQGLDKRKYQYLLLKVTGNNHFSIANQFNFSSLKKRIAMMNKMKSARAQLIKFLFIVPLVAVMLLAFRNDRIRGKVQEKPENFSWQTGDFTDSVPDVRINEKGYYVDIKGKNGECIVLVRDKNRKEIERLPLTKWDANKQHYTNLYGEIPAPPPPPPPPMAPTPPAPPIAPDASASPKLPDNVKSLHIANDQVTVTLKNGTKEEYDFKNENDRKAYQKKYGALVAPLPPPPPPQPHADGDHTIHAVPAPVLAIETSPKVATVTSGVGFKPAVAVTKPVDVTVESPVKLASTPTAPVSVGVPQQ
jgi:hypothetical protein